MAQEADGKPRHLLVGKALPDLPDDPKKQQVPLRKRRRSQPRKIRRDAGSWRNMSRDDDLLRFNPEQTFLRFDSPGEYLPPAYAPSIAEPPAEHLPTTPASPNPTYPSD